MSHDEVTAVPNPDQDEALAHAAIGAYILGALPESEAIAFEDHLRGCVQCQIELRELQPIADLLPRLYDDLVLPGLDPLPDGLEASGAVKERIVTEATSVAQDDESIEAGRVEVETFEADADAPAVERPAELTGDAPTVEAVEAVEASVEAVIPEVDQPETPDIASPPVEAEDSAAAGENLDAITAQVARDEAAEGVDTVAVTESSETVEAAAAAATAPTRVRPRGRIARGEAPPDANVVSLPRERGSLLPWALAAVAAVVAVGAILWALAMMGQIDDLNDERDLQDQQIAQMMTDREAYLADTPALVYPLIPTTAGATEATAMVYMDPDPEGWGGIVAFRGMSQPPSGQVYQLWTMSEDQMTPGPTFMPDASGQAIVQVGGGSENSGQMFITMEPSGGSDTPSTSPIMQGALTA
ncbi:MAG: anti-sigma factor [Thermomicrobiales bacterium]|nr:anti-sigma factor [Thermomicrobiales bacterium]MCO5223619.1 anti-sigma factor [Thermomicrobiales bacterium]